MITADQLKDIQERTEALHRYLDIDKKRIEFEEEQLRTQAPDFWDDPARAQEQMKKVKDIEKWVKDYDKARALADEVQLASISIKMNLSLRRKLIPHTLRFLR